MGHFRIAKRFTIDSGHRLSKHPEKCKFPHGHTRTVEVVIRALTLDVNDMVCDYKALKTVVMELLEPFDHAMVLAADDPQRAVFAPFAERVVLMIEGDPTTEVMARHLFQRIQASFQPNSVVVTENGTPYRVPAGIMVERVRIWETPTTWGEYGEDDE